MKKKASAVIICLWVLVILTMLAVGIGHRVSMALRLSRYQRDKLIASYLAKAGVERAIFEITNDTTANLINSKWASNKDVFEKIMVGANSQGFATVSYVMNDGFREETIFGVVDEERKINLNTAPCGLLEKLLDYVNADNPVDLAKYICGWRGDAGVTVPDAEYESLGYKNKGKPFTNIQELKLVKGMTLEIYKSLENLVTVHSSGKINLNTASPQILEIVTNYIISLTTSPTPNLSALAETTLKLRTDKIIFDSTFTDQLGLISADEASVVNNANLLDVKSTCFFITSNGKIEKNGFTQTLSVIYNRTGEIVYRYEG